MILRDRDRTVDLCCDNVVGLVSGDLWPASVFILCFVYFSLQCRRILRGRNLDGIRDIVVAAIFDFMTVEDWEE